MTSAGSDAAAASRDTATSSSCSPPVTLVIDSSCASDRDCLCASSRRAARASGRRRTCAAARRPSSGADWGRSRACAPSSRTARGDPACPPPDSAATQQCHVINSTMAIEAIQHASSRMDLGTTHTVHVASFERNNKLSQ